MPDFKYWSLLLYSRLDFSKDDCDTLEEALRQAFDQGYSLGRRRGEEL